MSDEQPVAGFGLAGLRREGGLIDPDTLGTVETPEREIEVRAFYAQQRAELALWDKSLAGRWSNFVDACVRAWRAFHNKDMGW